MWTATHMRSKRRKLRARRPSSGHMCCLAMDLRGGWPPKSSSPSSSDSIDFPPALKIPAGGSEHQLSTNGGSPFHTETLASVPVPLNRRSGFVHGTRVRSVSLGSQVGSFRPGPCHNSSAAIRSSRSRTWQITSMKS